jgi:hypothetical protein
MTRRAESSTKQASLRLVATVVAVLAASGCARQENSELQSIRAALDRNPTIEILAADEQTGVFTVRDKETGAVSAVSLQEIAAAPLSQIVKPRELPAVATPPAVASAPPAPAEVAPAASSQMAQAASASSEAAEPPPPQPVASASPEAKSYTIERTDGQLKISGPGISVVSAGTAAAPENSRQGPRAVDPIICEGRRMLHFDNRNIYVEGDAITVRGGCELYITNSNIVASGTGVIVHDGTVHIANSYIEGAASSFEADSRARVFVRGSTFQGLSRRDQLATVQDQGGNQWR